MSLGSRRAIVILLVVLVAAAASNCQRRQVPACAMCSKEIPARTRVALVSSSGDTAHACCARCALLFASKRAAGERRAFRSMAARDYETGESVELPSATFVYKSDIVPCCAPSIVVFANLERAQDFSAHAGGMVLDHGGVRAALALETGGRCKMCSKPMTHEAARPGVLLLANGESQPTCCPHCAFVLERMLDETGTRLEIYCTDDDGTPYRAGEESRFVAESDAPVCCRPMLVPCRSEALAESVVSRHGGRVLTIDEARELVRQHDPRSGQKTR